MRSSLVDEAPEPASNVYRVLESSVLALVVGFYFNSLGSVGVKGARRKGLGLDQLIFSPEHKSACAWHAFGLEIHHRVSVLRVINYWVTSIELRIVSMERVDGHGVVNAIVGVIHLQFCPTFHVHFAIFSALTLRLVLSVSLLVQRPVRTRSPSARDLDDFGLFVYLAEVIEGLSIKLVDDLAVFND